uniref:Uncharacterized protein n=1 Tax=Arundo donax TaxID=35708 RepID=A0A0A8ZMH1_ARUDO
MEMTTAVSSVILLLKKQSITFSLNAPSAQGFGILCASTGTKLLLSLT